MTDKTTKTLLLAIALGLWANAAVSLARPKELHAQAIDARDLLAIERSLNTMANSLNSICGKYTGRLSAAGC
jgi:hypothetical protein